ncbi:MAG: metallophosphoesterase, partial [Clostridia bacterium]|nr:metallophosphoesterase [Clostridia bacterium]
MFFKRDLFNYMKFIIFSDSHGYTGKMSEVLFNTNYDLVIHLGDCIRDVEKLKIEYPNSNICIIPGNNDFAFNESNEKILEFDGKKILACHGHKYNVKSGIDRLIYIAKQRQFDIVLFGHTHVTYNKINDGILFLNPGSVTQYGTYA